MSALFTQALVGVNGRLPSHNGWDPRENCCCFGCLVREIVTLDGKNWVLLGPFGYIPAGKGNNRISLLVQVVPGEGK
jgi:hypothetical protein